MRILGRSIHDSKISFDLLNGGEIVYSSEIAQFEFRIDIELEEYPFNEIRFHFKRGNISDAIIIQKILIFEGESI